MGTIAIQAGPELREQLDQAMELNNSKRREEGKDKLNLKETITEAITEWITKVMSDPDLTEKALAILYEEEQAFKVRRAAILALQRRVGGESSPDEGTQGGGEPTTDSSAVTQSPQGTESGGEPTTDSSAAAPTPPPATRRGKPAAAGKSTLPSS